MTAHPEGVLAEPIQCHRCGKELSAASAGYAMNATCDLFFCLVRCTAPEPASPPPSDREADRKLVIEARATYLAGLSHREPDDKDRQVARAMLDWAINQPPAVCAALSRLMGQG